MKLFIHQERAVEKMHNGCCLTGEVGTGKSITALAYWKKAEGARRVIVITTAKKRDSLDWQKDASYFLPIDMTVDSWNNIGKYEEVEDAFFIFDEQRIVGAGQWTKSFIRIAKRNRWILLSATPGDNWIDYIPLFVANGFYKNRTEFKREHVVYSAYSKFPKVERYVGVGKLMRHRKDVLVEMPYISHTVRHPKDVEVEYDVELMDKAVKKRWHVYEDRPIRDVAELFIVMRRIANSDKSRLEAVSTLLENHAKLIVFYNFNYELEMLRSLSTRLPLAEWNGHKHQPIPVASEWLYVVQYASGSEGWNCIETNATTFYSLTYSYKMFHQAHGRVDRLNTPFVDLWYYYLKSLAPIDKAAWRSLMGKKDFNERQFADTWGLR
jgi:hypothetical protein